MDEQKIPSKTKFSKPHQYNLKKHQKWGFKNLVMVGSSKSIYDFYLYVGKDDSSQGTRFSSLQKSIKVVVTLAEEVLCNIGHILFYNSWFRTLDLIMMP